MVSNSTERTYTDSQINHVRKIIDPVLIPLCEDVIDAEAYQSIADHLAIQVIEKYGADNL